MSDYPNPPAALLEPSAGCAAGDRVPCHLFMPDVAWPAPLGPVIRPERARHRVFMQPPVTPWRPVAGTQRPAEPEADRSGSWRLAAMLANRRPMHLVVAPDESKLAACFDQIKSDLIADGAVEHDLGLEFFPEAVLDAFRRQRAARIEAQQRLADAQELAAKSGLAHRMAVQRCVQAAVAEAVAAERDACVKFVRSFDTAMTDKIANELLLARGAA